MRDGTAVKTLVYETKLFIFILLFLPKDSVPDQDAELSGSVMKCLLQEYLLFFSLCFQCIFLYVCSFLLSVGPRCDSVSGITLSRAGVYNQVCQVSVCVSAQLDLCVFVCACSFRHPGYLLHFYKVQLLKRLRSLEGYNLFTIIL